VISKKRKRTSDSPEVCHVGEDADDTPAASAKASIAAIERERQLQQLMMQTKQRHQQELTLQTMQHQQMLEQAIQHQQELVLATRHQHQQQDLVLVQAMQRCSISI